MTNRHRSKMRNLGRTVSSLSEGSITPGGLPPFLSDFRAARLHTFAVEPLDDGNADEFLGGFADLDREVPGGTL
eukprot:CAMPEP_0174292416 /NCGR_PEP_ID=MMETSP0809-20121228/35450_1 /TAXON_ID=73025 ORGANISM="Eutreptiella gymnastica-like, Strain CCMP1594" /NCGR_SAMPLE_ID=MMETSP0809 /ASSEMBLY_ACC=CAM_ASM_000658 /LENGTH=73 /DNA_ID=CAMNT_0015392493 /DNA_START=1240 /DNA_END=1462 /DNA_ORIENTATION=-